MSNLQRQLKTQTMGLLVLFFTLLTHTSDAFTTSTVPFGRAALAKIGAKHQPMFVSTELPAETVGQSLEDDEVDAEVPVIESAAEDDAAPKKSKNQNKEDRIRHTLFVGNLPFDADENSVRDVVSQFGAVQFVAVPRDRESGKPRGFAFVDMSTPEEMDRAIAGVDGFLMNGRVLRANPSLPKDQQVRKPPTGNGMAKAYVGNLSYGTTEEMVVEHFKQFGLVFEVFMPTDEDQKSKGFAFVTVRKEELEEIISKANGSELDDREISVTMPLSSDQKGPRTGGAPRSKKPALTKIYVGNLSFYTAEETLEEVFSEFGTVHDCYIPRDKESGSSRGFGFISMSPEDAKRAIEELDECELDGRSIRVNESQPSKGRD